MNKFDLERVITGVDLIRSHYSLNDTVRGDYLIFINAILTTIGAQLGILYTNAEKDRSHWGNISFVDWHDDLEEFEKVYKIKPQVQIDKKNKHRLTFGLPP